MNMPETLKRMSESAHLQEVEGTTACGGLQEEVLLHDQFRVAETHGHEEAENTNRDTNEIPLSWLTSSTQETGC